MVILRKIYLARWTLLVYKNLNDQPETKLSVCTNTLIDQSLFVLTGPIMTNFLNQITGFITHLNCLSQTVKYFNSLINSYISELLKTVD